MTTEKTKRMTAKTHGIIKTARHTILHKGSGKLVEKQSIPAFPHLKEVKAKGVPEVTGGVQADSQR